jgi:hypothetical protein
MIDTFPLGVLLILHFLSCAKPALSVHDITIAPVRMQHEYWTALAQH